MKTIPRQLSACSVRFFTHFPGVSVFKQASNILAGKYFRIKLRTEVSKLYVKEWVRVKSHNMKLVHNCISLSYHFHIYFIEKKCWSVKKKNYFFSLSISSSSLGFLAVTNFCLRFLRKKCSDLRTPSCPSRFCRRTQKRMVTAVQDGWYSLKRGQIKL